MGRVASRYPLISPLRLSRVLRGKKQFARREFELFGNAVKLGGFDSYIDALARYTQTPKNRSNSKGVGKLSAQNLQDSCGDYAREKRANRIVFWTALARVWNAPSGIGGKNRKKSTFSEDVGKIIKINKARGGGSMREIDLNPTMQNIMEFLTKELGRGAKFISYQEIGKNLSPRRSRHAVEYSIQRLCRLGKLKIVKGKLSLL